MKKKYFHFLLFFSWITFSQNNTCEVSNQCIYTLRLNSLDGTGWNGNTMNIIQNNQIISTVGESFTSGNTLDVNIFLCDDSPFELFWNDGGEYPEKIKVTLISVNQNTLYVKEYGVESPNMSLLSAVAHCGSDCCFFYPFNLEVSSITETSALLTWQNEYNPSHWDIALLEDFSGFLSDNVPFTTVNTSPFLISTLQPCTNYTFYVRYRCSETSYSWWSQQNVIFSTECNLSLATSIKRNFVISPNPVDEVLRISSLENIENITIYNVIGQKQYKNYPNSTNTVINTTFLSPGIYFISISNSTQSETMKFIKK
jgi:Secretion system C-terminal sorting domain